MLIQDGLVTANYSRLGDFQGRCDCLLRSSSRSSLFGTPYLPCHLPCLQPQLTPCFPMTLVAASFEKEPGSLGGSARISSIMQLYFICLPFAPQWESL